MKRLMNKRSAGQISALVLDNRDGQLSAVSGSVLSVAAWVSA